MAIGPVQLIVLGFEHPNFHGEVIAELERLRESDTVRVIDALAVYKDAGRRARGRASQQPDRGRGDRARHQGRRADRPRHRRRRGHGGRRGAPAPRRPRPTAIHVFSDEEAWDVLEDIPNDSAAALILLEHHWAVPLRDAIARAGGFRISDGFISPLDLVAIGLLTAEEAGELHAMEKPRSRVQRSDDKRRRYEMFGGRRVARRTSRRTARRR